MSDVLSSFKSILKPLEWRVGKMRLAWAIRGVEKARVDPQVRYPSYKSFDEFIDIGALKALDGYVRERFAKRDNNDQLFWTGEFTERPTDERLPGSKIIFLTQCAKEHSDYTKIDQAEFWAETEAADEFSEVMEFVRSLPFKSVARVILMYDLNANAVTPHRDHIKTEICNEFIWIRMNSTKPFFVMNKATDERKYVEGYSAWFDTVNQLHGADAAQGLSISLRVDGKFSDELRGLIPEPRLNRASTPSYWATLGGKKPN